MLAAHMARASPPKVEAPKQSLEQGIVLSTYHSVSLNKYQWIIDSGASCHICIDLSQFSSITQVLNVFVTLPNSSQVPVQFVGNVIISKHLTLHDVYYVLGFHFNLISVSALLKYSNISIIFNSQFLLIQDNNHSKMIGRVELLEGLYVFKANSSTLPSSDIGASINSYVFPSNCSSGLQSVASCKSHTSNNVPLATWHAWLGHPSDKRLYALRNNIKFVSTELLFVSNCPICPLAKQCCLLFNSLNNMCTHAFDLIHVDLWGPFHTPTHSHHCYFLCVVDDHTCFTWIHLL